MNLNNTFIGLIKRYAPDSNASELWNEIELEYSAENRYYHTLNHLEHLLSVLQPLESLFCDWDAVLFTLYYHDMVYNARHQDNEEQSAVLAVKRMSELGVPEEIILLAEAHILATKSHDVQENNDTNLFTDADLAILGSDEETYMQYAENIRKEYSIYSDQLYYPGRKKVLEHFLDMNSLFKTDFFRQKMENQARKNVLNEIRKCEDYLL